MISLSKATKLVRSVNGVAAGQTVQNGASVDMKGHEGVVFVAAFGAITATAVTSLKAQQSSDDGNSDDWSDLQGTKVDVADDDDNKLAILDIARPNKRYVRPVVSRGTADAVIDGVYAILYGPKEEPTTHDASTVAAVEAHTSPAEGTA